MSEALKLNIFPFLDWNILISIRQCVTLLDAFVQFSYICLLINFMLSKNNKPEKQCN